jgi:hypothetical protein
MSLPGPQPMVPGLWQAAQCAGLARDLRLLWRVAATRSSRRCSRC